MKAAMKKVSMLAGMVSCCAMLSGCLTHWFEDSTTRLQVENRSSQTIVAIDILADDGAGYKVWIQDTIRTGEKSRVYEEDFVGTFRMRIRTTEAEYKFKHLELDGGSEYMVVSDSTKGLSYRFR
ncbi:hypothetical protein [Fibrobacter sp.]|uniref:hypothetical protein n=1 Tax=Fibrobacter sp. TaxID=35828 RepID=UPI00386F59F8